MMERRGPDALTREVLSPQRPSTGLGVALVASVAMLFAVGSSAFIVRARVLSQRCPAYPAAPAATQWTAATPVEPPCGTPAYHPNPDGSVMVFFTECPREAPPAATGRRVSDPSSYHAPIDYATTDHATTKRPAAMTIELGELGDSDL